MRAALLLLLIVPAVARAQSFEERFEAVMEEARSIEAEQGRLIDEGQRHIERFDSDVMPMIEREYEKNQAQLKADIARMEEWHRRSMEQHEREQAAARARIEAIERKWAEDDLRKSRNRGW